MHHAAIEVKRLSAASTGCHAFFMPSPDGQRFCIFHPAQGSAVRGLVLYIHPFAEEMNQGRRMAAVQSRALAAVGYAVLQIDLLGCGDSCGDFADARWHAWVTDVVRAAAWLRLQAAAPTLAPLWLWGLRAGCLLALQAARQLDEHCHFLFWQPPWSGRVLLQQFLRLRLAASWLGGTAHFDARVVMQSLRLRLQQGRSVDVAGYRLSADLADGLERALLTAPAAAVYPVRVAWFEVSALAPPALSTIPPELRQAWCDPGLRLVRHAVHGPAFWQSPDRAEAPELIAATTAALCAPGT